MLVKVLIPFLALLSIVSSQAIPYSYASGRDVAAVEARFARFTTAKASGAGPEEFFGICGRVNPSMSQCRTKIGRPKDSESLACDSLCCLAGYKVGNCGGDYGVQLDFAKIITTLASGAGTGGVVGGIVGSLSPTITANCYCSDDPTDIRCGRDGSFIGIRCPFDKSACWRKCCREGKSGGRCTGWLVKTKCSCD